MTSEASYNHYPAVILALLAALVTVTGLWMHGSASVGKQSHHQTANAAYEESFEWRMVTTWPKHFPGLGMAPERFAKNVERMSNGRLKVKVYGGGDIVPAMGVFDAVSQGNVEMGHAGAYYWGGKTRAAPFFTSVPFGLTAQEMNGWLFYGGGMELWREAYAPFNVVPLAGGNTGVQMAGWFNKEIRSLADLEGLKMRIPGIGGQVLARLGGTSVTLPGSELYTSLQTGVIDATEWVGPYNDQALGLYEVAEYYYYPGWHEPGPTLEMTVNKDAWDSLPADLQAIVEIAARDANQDMLDEYTARNNAALQNLIDNHGVQLRRLPDDVLRELKVISDQILKEYVAGDPIAEKVHASYIEYREGVKNYHRISEQAYINARDL